MKKRSSLRICFWPLSSLMVLCAGPLLAQVDAVRLLNGGGYLSESAIDAASRRLSTELPNHELRISYATNYARLTDRYVVYDSSRLLPFGAIPNPAAGLAATSEEEMKMGLRTGIHHALTTAPGGDGVIHIVYATMVGLDSAGQEVVRTWKYFHFGPAVSRLDKLKVKQIKPSPELEVLSGAAQNDAYLAAYVDELIGALNDPDYAINGTIRYRNELYADGDTIYYFPANAATIRGPLPDREALELRINARYPVSPAGWQPGAAAQTLVEEESGRWLYLRLYPQHFQDIYALRAVYGNQSATVYFYPVNLQIYVEPDTLKYLEPHAAVQEHAISAYNNGNPFGSHPGLAIRTRIACEDGAVLAAEALAPPPFGADRLIFGIDALGLRPAQGRQYTIIMELLNGAGQAVCTRRRELGVKWPFDLRELLVTPSDNAGEWKRERQVSSLSGDTLYIVSSNNDLTRDIGFRLNWAGGERPGVDDYWNSPGPGAAGPEPVFSFGNSGQIAMPSLTKRRQGPFSVSYGPAFFPGAGVFSIDAGAPDIDYYRAKVRAFGEEYGVVLGFLREGRQVHQMTLPNWLATVEGFINNHFNETFEKIKRKVPIPFDIGVQIQSTASRTLFYSEYEKSANYQLNEEISPGLSIGLNGRATWDFAPSDFVTIGPYINVGISMSAAYEKAMYQIGGKGPSIINAHSFEAVLGGEIEIGAVVDIDLVDEDNTGLTFSVSANGSFPLESKGKLESNIEDDRTCIKMEANAGPASLNVNISAGIAFDWGEYNVDMNMFAYTWKYALMDKNFSTLGAIKVSGKGSCD